MTPHECITVVANWTLPDLLMDYVAEGLGTAAYQCVVSFHLNLT